MTRGIESLIGTRLPLALKQGRRFALRQYECSDFANYPAEERVTLGVQHGAVGVDFNVDHLAVTEADLYGNIARSLPLLWAGQQTAGGDAPALSAKSG